MEEGTIVKWLVAQGDAVEPGHPLVEIETDKATVTYEADDSGVIVALHVREGALVPVGAPIAVLGEAGDELITERSAGALATSAGADAVRPFRARDRPSVRITQAPGQRSLPYLFLREQKRRPWPAASPASAASTWPR